MLCSWSSMRHRSVCEQNVTFKASRRRAACTGGVVNAKGRDAAIVVAVFEAAADERVENRGTKEFAQQPLGVEVEGVALGGTAPIAW